MHLPASRGALSASVVDALAGGRLDLDRALALATTGPGDPVAVLEDEDRQLALWVLYELHYRGFDGVDEALEWDPDLLRLRRALEEPFEAAVRALCADSVAKALEVADGGGTDGVVAGLESVIADDDGPSLARFVQREASVPQFREFMALRSIYHLKESDPASFALPRVDGPAKVALAELQYDEFGSGRPERLHSDLFARSLRGCDLSGEYGAYLDVAPAHTLALNNVMSLFGLHRRLRGAAMGHLSVFEMTSSLPCKKYAGGAARLGYGEDVTDYYDEHVEADAVHEHLAARGICGSLVAAEPGLLEDVLLGGAACVQLEALAATRVTAAWEAGGSALLAPLEGTPERRAAERVA